MTDKNTPTPSLVDEIISTEITRMEMSKEQQLQRKKKLLDEISEIDSRLYRLYSDLHDLKEYQQSREEQLLAA